jgi:hypothetical protein
MVERSLSMREVAGSIPASSSFYFFRAAGSDAFPAFLTLSLSGTNNRCRLRSRDSLYPGEWHTMTELRARREEKKTQTSQAPNRPREGQKKKIWRMRVSIPLPLAC